MDLTKSTDEFLDDLCRLVYEKLYGTGAKSLDTYLDALAEELKERNIACVTRKKCMDKHRERYFKVDLVIPPMERFIMLKSRKHVTRADMNQFRLQETSVGYKGLLVNFYNGVDVRESTSLLPGEEKREAAKLNVLKGRGIGGGKSSSVDRLPGIASDRRILGSRSWGGSSNTIMPSKSTTTLPSATMPIATSVDFAQIFAASCAAFFISEGDRATFASAFNDFLSQMSIKRLTFPRKHLSGAPLEKPDGVLNENLEYFFKTSSIAASVKKKKDDESGDGESNRTPTPTDETRKSPQHHIFSPTSERDGRSLILTTLRHDSSSPQSPLRSPSPEVNQSRDSTPPPHLRSSASSRAADEDI